MYRFDFRFGFETVYRFSDKYVSVFSCLPFLKYFYFVQWFVDIATFLTFNIHILTYMFVVKACFDFLGQCCQFRSTLVSAHNKYMTGELQYKFINFFRLTHSIFLNIYNNLTELLTN